MKTPIIRKKRKGGFTLIELMVVIAILAALASIGYGPILDHMNDGERQKANANLGTIFKLLQQFKMDNGNYPCDATADRLQDDNTDFDFGELKGNHSNAYFRQLYFKSDVVSERPFYANVNVGALSVTEGDERIAKGQALRPGENAMSYVMRRDPQDETVKLGVTKSNAPLAMCSVYPSKTPYSGDKVVFDRVSFRGHVFVLSSDGSVNDREKDVAENPDRDEIGEMKPDKSLFPETRRGRSTAQEYIVLTPEF